MTDRQDENVASAPARDLLGEPFRLDSIRDVPAPEGGEGVWQQYVIVQGTNTIIGLRAGTRSEVSLQVEGMVERLNERFRKGKVPPAEGPGRKPSFRPGRPSGSRSHTPRPP